MLLDLVRMGVDGERVDYLGDGFNKSAEVAASWVEPLGE